MHTIQNKVYRVISQSAVDERNDLAKAASDLPEEVKAQIKTPLEPFTLKQIFTNTVRMSRDCINNITAPGGITPTEMAKRLKVLEKLQDENVETFNLEDSEFETLKDCVSVIRFTKVDADLLDFYNGIMDHKPNTVN